MSGVLCSDSHLETACLDTPTLSASSSCEIPLIFRKCCILSAIFIAKHRLSFLLNLTKIAVALPPFSHRTLSTDSCEGENPDLLVTNAVYPALHLRCPVIPAPVHLPVRGWQRSWQSRKSPRPDGSPRPAPPCSW